MSNDNTTDDEEQPAEQFVVAQTGPLHYTVLSSRSGQRAHRVNIQTLRCSCEDMTFNRNLQETAQGGRDVCDHLAHCLDVHPQLDATESAVYQSMSLMDGAQNLYTRIEEQRDQLEEAIVALRDAQAGLEASNSAGESDTADSDESGADTDGSAPGGMTDEDVEQAASDLQEAFDELIGDMEVQAHEGVVWFKTGYDTPDEWPYPGGDDTWEVLVKNPDHPEYVGEGGGDYPAHDLYEKKPGEYWKNILRPDDVDAYISEVLE